MAGQKAVDFLGWTIRTLITGVKGWTLRPAIIIAMGLAALATPLPLLIAGAALFMASDTLLGLQTFVLAAGNPRERIANALIWPLYWGAIVLLTLGTVT